VLLESSLALAIGWSRARRSPRRAQTRPPPLTETFSSGGALAPTRDDANGPESPGRVWTLAPVIDSAQVTKQQTLDADEIRALLLRVGGLAAQRGAELELVLLGGAAVALLFESRRSTRDIDVVSARPRELLVDLAAEVARADGLSPRWISDEATRFATTISRGPLLLEGPGIRAHSVSRTASRLEAGRDA
jgi:hypothetical protein